VRRSWSTEGCRADDDDDDDDDDDEILHHLKLDSIIKYKLILPPPYLWSFDPIRCHGLHLWAFAITLVGHTTLGKTSLDE